MSVYIFAVISLLGEQEFHLNGICLKEIRMPSSFILMLNFIHSVFCNCSPLDLHDM